MNNAEIVIRLQNVTKIIKKQKVLDNINLEIEKGLVYGFVGRNASGKTMLFRIICGLVFPTSGRVEVFNKEIGKNGLMPGNIGAII